MNARRVVITGLGVIASNGTGKNGFFDALMQGASGIKEVSLFDTAPFGARTAGEVTDFKPEDFLGPKGLRILDRSTKLSLSAGKLALDDAGISIGEGNSPDTGVCLGSTLGSIASISDFDREAIKEGARYVNPALFPNTVINSPASQISIRFNIRGFNTTISTGFSAGLDAAGYAADFIRSGRVSCALAGGTEELCVQAFLGFSRSGCLAGLSDDAPELSCPFDRRRNGLVLGEGSALLVLEELGPASGRGGRICAEILGYANCFDPSADGLSRSMRMALQEARTQAQDIDYLCAGANSTQAADLLETRAVKDVFGPFAKGLCISSIKSMTGECYSASGALQLAAAVAAIERQAVPPTVNYSQPDPGCDLDYVANTARQRKVDRVLINAFSPDGFNSSMVIGRFN